MIPSSACRRKSRCGASRPAFPQGASNRRPASRRSVAWRSRPMMPPASRCASRRCGPAAGSSRQCPASGPDNTNAERMSMMRRLLIVVLALFVSSAANAQTLTQRPVSQGAVTPADMTERLEKAAARTKEQAPKGAARGSSIDFCWPSSVEEYQAIGKYVLVLVSVVTQDAVELPLRRVYVTVNGEQTELVKLSSSAATSGKGR